MVASTNANIYMLLAKTPLIVFFLVEDAGSSLDKSFFPVFITADFQILELGIISLHFQDQKWAFMMVKYGLFVPCREPGSLKLIHLKQQHHLS